MDNNSGADDDAQGVGCAAGSLDGIFNRDNNGGTDNDTQGVGCAASSLCGQKTEKVGIHDYMNFEIPMHGALCSASWNEKFYCGTFPGVDIKKVLTHCMTAKGKKDAEHNSSAWIRAKCIKVCSK